MFLGLLSLTILPLKYLAANHWYRPSWRALTIPLIIISFFKVIPVIKIPDFVIKEKCSRKEFSHDFFYLKLSGMEGLFLTM